MQALQQGPASLVVPLSEIYLVITVLLAVVFLGESLTLRKLLGLGLMMAGAALLAREGM
jgi:transporter family protein